MAKSSRNSKQQPPNLRALRNQHNRQPRNPSQQLRNRSQRSQRLKLHHRNLQPHRRPRNPLLLNLPLLNLQLRPSLSRPANRSPPALFRQLARRT